MSPQDKMKKFYDVDNLLTVKLTIPTFEDLKAAEPRGGTGYLGHRYDWHKCDSIEISGTKYPEKPHTFKNVGVIKKSYFGSFDKEKPSMRVDFLRFDKKNDDDIQDLLGSDRITLNNCKQDPGYLRQPLVYELLRQAECPYFRCNFVKVFVNDTDMGLYVNFEPFRKRYVQRNFDNDKGNAYELDFGADFDAKTIESGQPSHEGFSKFEDKKDFILATKLINEQGLAGAKKVFDWGEFMKFWAMEVLVKHRDGYTCHQNNSFAYNDVKSVAEPTEDSLNFKFVPSGVDLTVGQNQDPKFYMGTRAIVAKLVSQDETETKRLMDQIKKYQETVFSADNYKKSIEPFIERLVTQMKAAGIKFDDAMTSQVDWAKRSIQDCAGDGPQNLTKKE